MPFFQSWRLPLGAAVSTDRTELLNKAVERWAAALLDTTGNNRLIYYRKLQQGTLELESCVPAELAKLDSGVETTVRRLFAAAPDLDDRDGHVTSQADLQDRINERIVRANKRAKTIFNKSKVYEEEKGISILYLARGFLTWPKDPNKESVPNAPVLLAPLEIRRADAAGSDFKITRIGDWEVNETLLRFLSEQFNLPLAKDIGTDSDGEPIDTPELVVEKLQAALPRIRFSLNHEQIIGNFTYAKLPMVKDLQDNREMLLKHDLIAAIAGDTRAEAEVRESNQVGLPNLSDPNFTSPADEFLVLDADSSQNYVINAAIAGKSLVVEGPPGTGKSQTIANTIAALTARGRSVLFVAEKRAAINAVAKRLTSVGLQDLVFDLHVTDIKSRNVIQSLQATSQAARAAERHDYEERHRMLERRRQTLLDHSQAIHEKQGPWNLSLFDINANILRFDTGHTVNLEGPIIDSFTQESINSVRETIVEWVDRRRDMDWTSAWSRSDVLSKSDAQALIEVAEELRARAIPQIRKTLGALSEGLDVPLEQLNIEQVLTLLDLSRRVQRHEEYFDPDLWLCDLEEVDQGLSKGLFSTERRGAVQVLKSLRRKRIWSKSRMQNALRAAIEDREQWRQFDLGVPPNDSLASSEAQAQLDSLQATISKLGVHHRDTLESFSIIELQQFASDLDADRSVVLLMGLLAESRSELARAGFLELVERVETGEIAESAAEKVALQSIYEAIKRRVETKTPAISGFSSSSHNSTARDFLEGDAWHQETTPNRIRRKAAESLQLARNEHQEQASILNKELNKRSRHKKLRELQELAPDVLKSLKPCWMMSPLMVSQVLPPKAIFDYVIFDEASQIRPEDAVCSIARGKNTLIAGDRKQLPPSRFFDGGDGESLDDEESSPHAMTSGYESILDLTAALLPVRMLEWHYRSRDEKLISLSNAHMYGGSLVTFPGNVSDSPIAWHPVQYTPVAKGEERSNKAEVEKVVDLILEHALARSPLEADTDTGEETVEEDDNSESSLGVIAFGQAHASAIEAELSRRLQESRDPVLEEFFSDRKREPFFVKNLERVQGDERDTIILSVGYGKDPSGLVPQRFGPINQEGGERRINVAVSRARSQMTVVSSIKASDITASSKGPQLLRALLGFAESLGNDVGLEREHEPLNPFEVRVQFELEQLGMRVIPQYGVGRFRIDFAISDPDDPNRLVLAVEADGASYHAQPTARDRDRLRQQILEDKGWRFYRIWSTDFFKNPQAEAQRVKNALLRAVEGERDLIPIDVDPTDWNRAPTSQTKPRRPNLRTGVPIAQHDIRQLVALVKFLTDDGQVLLTDDELRDQMKDELGYARLGANIKATFDNAIQIARGEAPLPKARTPRANSGSKRGSPKAANKGTTSKCSCGGYWVKRSGPFGTFWGCSNYRSKGCKKKRPR